MIPELIGSRFPTVKTYRFAGNTAGVTLDLSSQDYLGPCDALFVQIEGAARAIEINEGGSGLRMTIAAGRTPVFDTRIHHLVIQSGAAADLVVGCCYSDRWGT